jgi:hypothetical protein
MRLQVPVATVRCAAGVTYSAAAVLYTGDTATAASTTTAASTDTNSPAAAVLQHLSTAGLAQACPLRYTVQWDHVPSAFVEASVWLDTGGVSPSLRLHLPLYLDALFDLGVVLEDGSELSHEDTARQLASDTVSYRAGLVSAACNCLYLQCCYYQ